IRLEPGGERLLAPSVIEQGHPAGNLSDGDGAKVEAVLVDRIEPGKDARLRMRATDFGEHVGVEQIFHNSISRPWSWSRSGTASSSAPARGEAIRKEARLPWRLVLRCHSSTDTITTLGRPLRVMVCGSFWARA